ncbi:hypothetical protein V2I01_03870 [Micromonospora sp. BRA006-A]|nr:hypothetical protein [Micromonospora sp. BRA006-A]
MAYVSWPFALVHGLNAGRPAAGWVVLSYLACVVLVVMALLVRLSVHLGKRSREQHQAVALNKAMAGKGRSVPACSPRSPGRRPPTRRTAAPAGPLGRGDRHLDRPAGTARRRDPERFAVPVVPEPGSLREPVRAAAARRRDAEPDAPARRARTRRRPPAAATRSASRRPRPRRGGGAPAGPTANGPAAVAATTRNA